MPVVKFDVSDVDPTESAAQKEYPKPRPGVYLARVRDCTVNQPANKDPRIECTLEIIQEGEPSKGWYKTMYVNLVSVPARWRLDQFLQAFGLATDKKRTGSFNTDKLLGKECKIRVKSAFYTPEPDGEAVYSPEISGVFSKDSGEGDGDFDPHAKDDVDPHADAEDEADTETETETEVEPTASADENWTRFLGMDEDELAEVEEEIRPYCAQVGIDPDTIATWTEVVEEVNDRLNNGPFGDGPAETASEEDTADTEDEYDDDEVWPLAELKAELGRRGLDQKGTRAKVIERLRAADASA